MQLIKLFSRRNLELASRIAHSLQSTQLQYQPRFSLSFIKPKNVIVSLNQRCQQYNFGSEKIDEEEERYDSDSATEKLFRNQQILVEQQKFDEAIQNWSNAKSNADLKGIPQSEIDYQISKTYLLKGDIKLSSNLFLEYLKSIESIYSQTDVASECFQIAQEFQSERKFEESIVFYELSFKKNNENIETHLQYIDNLIRNMNMNEKAIDHIYKIMSNNKLYTPMLFQQLGEAYFNKREYKQSIDYLLKYLEVLLSKDSNLDNQSQEEKIKEEFKKKNMEVASVFLKIASSYYFVQNYEKSLEYYLKNFDFQKEHQFDISHQMYLNISELFLKLQKFDKSLEFLKTGSEKYPSMLEFQYFQGMVYLNYIKDIKKAQTAFEAAVKINSKHLDSLKQLGLIYLRQQNYDQSEEMFLDCLKIYQNDTDALYYMAYILQYHHKSPTDALICYQLCLDINSELPAPLMQCAIIHYDLKNYDKAIEFITKAHESDPQSEQIKILFDQMKGQQKIEF